jgi:hypothetical protein
VKSFWGILFLVALAACSPTQAVTPQIKTANVVPTNTSIVLSSPTATITESAIVVPTESSSTSGPITPKAEIIAPGAREVGLSDLELNDSTRLILYYPSSDSLRIMSKHDIRPQKIPNINPKDILNYGIRVSPNQEWFIYNVFKELRDGIAYYDLWISSIDGKNRNIAVSDVRGATEVRWVTNELLELWYHPDGARVCPERELIVNPFTQEKSISPQLPPSISPQCFFDLSTNPERSKFIYLNKDGLWSIYDFRAATSQTVFPWLSKSERFALWPRYIHWSPSGITIVLPDEDSIDFVSDLPVLDASKTNISLKRILLPDGKKIYNKTFSWWTLDKGFVGFDLVQSDFDYFESGNETPPTKFVILDLNRFVLYDYNLDRARTGEMQKYADYFVKASADNRFLAWTIFGPPGMGTAIETVVLDRQTGQIARIRGFEFLGWGEVIQP